jgi:hypothetical protein
MITLLLRSAMVHAVWPQRMPRSSPCGRRMMAARERLRLNTEFVRPTPEVGFLEIDAPDDTAGEPSVRFEDRPSMDSKPGAGRIRLPSRASGYSM